MTRDDNGDFFLCGIGGSGMSALAQLLRDRGHGVRGSDRTRDRGGNRALYERLLAQGVRLFPQDGSGVSEAVGTLVVSSAVEPTVPDVKAALAGRVAVRRRAEVLAELFHRASRRIAVAGTSGKTTITGMIGHILARTGREPTVVNGGVVPGWDREPMIGNVRCGTPETMVIEADESDGTIALYHPTVGVVSNISVDHKPIAELRSLFGDFLARSGVTVTNADCPESRRVAESADGFRFAVAGEGEFTAGAVRITREGSAFTVAGVPVRLPVPGDHNVANALAAMAACAAVGVSAAESAAALADFPGIHRRLEMVGHAAGVAVIDDFAHNPDKIAASLAALRPRYDRLLAIFQPHGFGPTRFLRDGLVAAFAEGLRAEDVVAMPEIFYAGGTASRDLSSADLIGDITAAGRRGRFFLERSGVADWVVAEAAAGDAVVVMGARDDSLAAFAREILRRIDTREKETR